MQDKIINFKSYQKVKATSQQKNEGFTLVEIMVVIGIIAILAGVILVAVNPARQFKLARDLERSTNLEAILNAISQNMSENKGRFVCSGNTITIPSATTSISSQAGALDIAECLVPNYLARMPKDPTTGTYLSTSSYDTKYSIKVNEEGRLFATAQGELTAVISAIR